MKYPKRKSTENASSSEKNSTMNDKPVKVILDTNIWVAFLIGKDVSFVLRNLLIDNSIAIVTTKILQTEVKEVTSRPKFARHFAPEASRKLLAFLQNRCMDYPLGDIPRRCRDPKDDYLLELARVAKADVLITGDKDLTDLRQFGQCRIMTLADFQREFQP